MNSKNF